ncbi:50S ribosomal protein L31 [Candidatus Carsonella ruddii]|uniref:Ribosomal protein L31 n=1 Tax=Candidatus Carsonella ruddii CE isolate Thao2000 TaxID=1202536 RepID=J7GZS6_CARRU|nr:50S ribosomal protein L31 [Candidatus Carsonella ruddii]AFP83500.1 ribosomal protein L31 [Candidatus Carsonella ruddii CE isolate Thao2000]
MKILFECSCKKKYNLFSSYKKNLLINNCSYCHSFYNKNKFSNNFSTKINNFNKKYEKFFYK